ncbi:MULTISPECIES: hypothetical protein [Flammeovirga]|nr:MULTISPECIES: hypothetical protein [Flammeovirga]MBB6463216.1 hypothetical protein [Flammeovirga kamogawensis]
MKTRVAKKILSKQEKLNYNKGQVQKAERLVAKKQKAAANA